MPENHRSSEKSAIIDGIMGALLYAALGMAFLGIFIDPARSLAASIFCYIVLTLREPINE